MPLIDILLVLLVVFMLLQVRHVLEVTIPPLSTPVPQPLTPQLVLELPNEGGFRLNGQPVPERDLEIQLGSAFGGRANRLLFISAGSGRTYREVVAAMDRARSAGVQVLGLVPPTRSTR